MAQVNYIKDLRENQGKSINAIAKAVACSWETAKKYADGDVDLRVRGRRKRDKPVIGPFEDIINAWLEEDQRRPRKQRRTAAKIYRDLCEIGFSGASKTVREYVGKRKQQMKDAAREQYVRLEHAPGTAQVDFGEFQAVYNGQEVTAHALTLSFPYSNAYVTWVLPSQNTACFLYGLSSLFELVGGVPPVIWFDNLKPAVKKVLQGEDRELTEMFQAFKWYYRFEAVFCNPGRGNEKGNIENKVGYERRNFLTPVPVIDEWDGFSLGLNERQIADWQRPHYAKKVAIAKLWEDDQSRLLMLPRTPFEVAQFQRVTVNNYGEVKVDKQVYHVPTMGPGRKVLVKAYWDHLEILDEHGETQLFSCPRHYMMNPKEIDWPAELELFTRRPRAIEHASYLKALPPVIREYLLPSDLSERRERVRAMIDVLTEHRLEVAVQAVDAAQKAGRTDYASLMAFASYAADTGTPAPFDEPWTPAEVAQWEADLDAYNRLVVSR